MCCHQRRRRPRSQQTPTVSPVDTKLEMVQADTHCTGMGTALVRWRVPTSWPHTGGAGHSGSPSWLCLVHLKHERGWESEPDYVVTTLISFSFVLLEFLFCRNTDIFRVSSISF